MVRDEFKLNCDKTLNYGPGPKLDFRANSPAHLGSLMLRSPIDGPVYREDYIL